jgi:hypothetical protein
VQPAKLLVAAEAVQASEQIGQRLGLAGVRAYRGALDRAGSICLVPEHD